MAALVIVLRVVAVLVAAGTVVVVGGAFVPRVPVAGFLGSFVAGQYPVYALLGALMGAGLGVGLLALGSRGVGAGVTVVGALGVVGLVVVLAAQASLARTEGVRVDWALTLTAVDQTGASPDVTARYSTDPPLDLDLYLPPGPGPYPVLVWAHGGSWVRGERTDRAAAHRWLAERGVAVAAVTYRLPPPAPVGDGQRRDLAAAVAWVRAHAAEHGLDPARVLLAGQSAGATIALATAAALRGTGTTAGPDAVAGVAAFYPVVDMTMIAPQLRDAVFGGPAGDAALAAASPDRQVRPGMPPVLVVLGSADHFVYAGLVRRYDRDLRAAGTPGRLLVVPYADHVFDHPFGSPGAQVVRPALLRFVQDTTRLRGSTGR